MTVLEHIKQLALNLTPEEKIDLAQYLAESNGENPPGEARITPWRLEQCLFGRLRR